MKNTGANHLSVNFSSYTSELSSSLSEDDSRIAISSPDAEYEDSFDFVRILNFLDHSDDETSAFNRTTEASSHASNSISDVSGDEFSEFMLDSFSIVD